MTLRWIVDVDGSGLYRVAADVNGRSVFQSEPGSREVTERALTRLRSSDAAETQRQRRESGERLARLRRPHPA